MMKTLGVCHVWRRCSVCLMLLAITMTVNAQSIEPNLKWGKPTDEELNMTEYAADKEAKAVVLCHLTSVNYTMDLYNYLVDYHVKKRIKILKDEGKDYANISIPYIYNMNEEYGEESIESFKATAYNIVNGKVVKTKIGKEQIHTERIDEDYMLAKVAIPQVRAGQGSIPLSIKEGTPWPISCLFFTLQRLCSVLYY